MALGSLNQVHAPSLTSVAKLVCAPAAAANNKASNERVHFMIPMEFPLAPGRHFRAGALIT
jgi:hypothetical protein